MRLRIEIKITTNEKNYTTVAAADAAIAAAPYVIHNKCTRRGGLLKPVYAYQKKKGKTSKNKKALCLLAATKKKYAP